MRLHFDPIGGIQRLFGGGPKVGELVEVGPGETLTAPPRGRLWYSPSWAPKGVYELHDLIARPVLEPGDIFGIHPKDPIPLPPSGTELLRLHNPKTEGVTGAVVYKVVPTADAAVAAVVKPTPPVLHAYALQEQPVPKPGQRWHVVAVDGRNLGNVYGVMIAA
jgi:hypothetical protein